MDEKIVLDDKSFKALSADSRVNILKNLKERRRTLSELSQKLNLGSSTVKEHCEILIGADLIRQIDEGRKWKYYELTQKGKQIVSPSLFDEVKVLIVLCFGVIVAGGVIFLALQMFSVGYGTNVFTSAQSARDYSAVKDYSTISINNQLHNENYYQNDSIPSGLDTSKSIQNETDTGKGVNDTNQDYDLNAQNNPNLQDKTTCTQPVRQPFDGNCQDQQSPYCEKSCGSALAQCSVRQQGATPELYVFTTIIALIFGAILGWIATRKN